MIDKRAVIGNRYLSNQKRKSGKQKEIERKPFREGLRRRRTMKRTCRNLLPVVLAVLLAAMAVPPVALGQKDSGAIAGIVRDSAGAVVPDAKISVKDVDRGTETVVTSSAQGEYVASPLKIGRYSVIAEKAGFKKTVVGPITVNIQEHPEVDITLTVGSIHEVMTITSEGLQLQTET